MEIAGTTIGGYLDALASNAPAPGGGSSAALSGAMGAALVSMVANLTAGREKYAAHQELVSETLNRTSSLIRELTECVQKDMKAFDGVMAAYRLPKDSPERSRRFRKRTNLRQVHQLRLRRSP